jgi:hypothetical protein
MTEINFAYLKVLCDHEQHDPPAFREVIEALEALTTLRPISEYEEDMGDVLWWKLPITEPPYVGSPNYLGQEVLISLQVNTALKTEGTGYVRVHVGGWPGYHTHWSPIPKVMAP